jgi:hypothetical protein
VIVRSKTPLAIYPLDTRYRCISVDWREHKSFLGLGGMKMTLCTRRLSWGIAFVVAAFIVGALQCQQKLNAAERLLKVSQNIRQAKKAEDTGSYLRESLQMYRLLNGSPRSTAQLILAEVAAGRKSDALRSFAEFVRMGQSNNEPVVSKALNVLQSEPRYAALQAAMVSNVTARSTGIKAFGFASDMSIPEDIDFDPATKLFYITSVLGKQIVAVDGAGSERIFANAPDSWPMMAIKVDSKRHVLWATEVAIDGFSSCPHEDWGRSAIILYDLSSGRILHRIEGPPHTALGDMTLTAEGDAVVSDGDHGGVYRVYRKTQRIERIDAGDFISPQTPAVMPDGRHILVPDYLRGIGVLDVRTKAVFWIPMEGKYALDGIDGLYLSGRTLLATQNGTSPERVIRFELDPSLKRIESESIIERATPTLGDPTHGVIVDDRFYYIANSGWETLDEHGDRKAGAQITDALLMRSALHRAV